MKTTSTCVEFVKYCFGRCAGSRAAAAFAFAFVAAFAQSASASYAQLEYIQSTGAQYIKSGYTPSSTDKIEVTLSFNTGTTGNTQGIFCSRGSSTTKDSYTLFLFSSKFRIDHGNGSSAQVSASGLAPSADTQYVVIADGSTLDFSVDGTSYATMHDESYTPGSELIFCASWMGGTSSLGNWGKFKLYRVRILDWLLALQLRYRKEQCRYRHCVFH